MPDRNLVLTDDDQDMIDRLVKSGKYRDASDVVREGLRLVDALEGGEAAQLAALREAAALGFADLDQGRFTDVAVSDVEEHIARLGRRAIGQTGRSGPLGDE